MLIKNFPNDGNTCPRKYITTTSGVVFGTNKDRLVYYFN